MSNPYLPTNLFELPRFIRDPHTVFSFVRRPGDLSKDPFTYLNRLGLQLWRAEDMIRSLTAEECVCKDGGDPCDDPQIPAERMWKFLYSYHPIGLSEFHTIYIKLAPQMTIDPRHHGEQRIVIVISFHESKSEDEL